MRRLRGAALRAGVTPHSSPHLDRGRERDFSTHAVLLQPCRQRVPWDAQRFRPIRQRLGFTLVGDADVVPLVSRLDVIRSPSAIARLVVAGIVYPVYAVAWAWFWPHVIEEGRERLPPLVADLDPTPAVPAVVWRFWICASVDDSDPGFVFGSVGHPVCEKPFGRLLPV